MDLIDELSVHLRYTVIQGTLVEIYIIRTLSFFFKLIRTMETREKL